MQFPLRHTFATRSWGHATRRVLLLAALVSTAAVAAPLHASASDVTIVINPGPLSFIDGTPGNLTFTPVSLNGTNSVSDSATMLFDVSDATGSGSGWRIQATSTQFSDGSGHTLPTNAVTIQLQPAPLCNSNSNCVLATTNVSYPYTLPAGNNVVATTMFNATANTGMGDESIEPVFSINLPPSVIAATYSATWSFSLVSGP